MDHSFEAQHPRNPRGEFVNKYIGESSGVRLTPASSPADPHWWTTMGFDDAENETFTEKGVTFEKIARMGPVNIWVSTTPALFISSSSIVGRDGSDQYPIMCSPNDNGDDMIASYNGLSISLTDTLRARLNQINPDASVPQQLTKAFYDEKYSAHIRAWNADKKWNTRQWTMWHSLGSCYRPYNEFDKETAKNAWDQIGLWSRGCLDIKNTSCHTINNGLYAENVLVQTDPNRRGNIKITINGADLWDVTFDRFNKNTVDRIDYHDLDTRQLHELFGSISGAEPDHGWKDAHNFSGSTARHCRYEDGAQWEI